MVIFWMSPFRPPTFGVVLALVLVNWTKIPRLDPILALVVAALIFWTSWRILWQSIDGLMDRTDPKDDAAICAILDDEIKSGGIRGYHKVRHRRSGTFYWVDMHLQVEPTLTVVQGHELASRIEYRIEQKFGGRAKATAHVEPYEAAAV
jgi:ferrous-iron efflux pump FieF